MAYCQSLAGPSYTTSYGKGNIAEMKPAFPLAIAFVASFCWTPCSSAWGGHGHTIQARAAVAALPDDMPGFFRRSADQLAYLIIEPDRWRSRGQMNAKALTGPSHTFKWEVAPKPLPPTRDAFI